MRALITVVDSITETSMPVNEFVLYRAGHYSDERHFLIVCGASASLSGIEIPQNLEILYVKRKLGSIRKVIKGIIDDCNRRGIPYIIHLHQVQSAFLAEFAMLGTGMRKKTLFTVHSTFSGYRFHNKCLSFANSLLAQQVTCVSQASYSKYPQLIKRLKRKRFQVVQNGVDTERIDVALSTIRPVPHDCYCFIYVARFIPIKNHQFLLNVLKKCNSKVHFIFVGEEDKEKTISKKAKELGLTNQITFTGILPRNAVFAELQKADFYISASILEGMPVSVLEAMYCGLPCVLSNILPHIEIAQNMAAILPFDVEKWVEEIDRLIKLPKERREEISRNIRSYVMENYSLSKMHQKYDEVYMSLY